MVFNTGPYTDLPDNSILITANMQSETGFPSGHQLKSYVAYRSRLKLAARTVLSADAGFLVYVSFHFLLLRAAVGYVLIVAWSTYTKDTVLVSLLTLCSCLFASRDLSCSSHALVFSYLLNKTKMLCCVYVVACCPLC